tara:strand:+ start:171 stop:497 length:327 start_codon:yes stop_codon:yes gene_type:complete
MNKLKNIKKFEPIPSFLTIKESNIHGLGLFATEKIEQYIELGISHIKDNRFIHGYIRTPLGGFFNHSKTPNCEAIYDGDFIKIRTLIVVNSADEITVNYELHNWIKEG